MGSPTDVATFPPSVPRMLQRARRALCPTCGAPLALTQDSPQLECCYCGALAVVERRLRKADIELVAGTDPALVARPPTPFLPAHALVKGGRTHGQCPECAAPIELDGAADTLAPAPALHGHFTCAHCGVRSKVELRLAPEAAATLGGDGEGARAWARFDADVLEWTDDALAAREAALRAELRGARLAAGAALADELRDLAVRRVLRARDEAALHAEADTFEPWDVLTPWRERALVRLMQRAGHVGPDAQRALIERMIARVAAAAWKHDGARAAYVRGVVRAAGAALYSPTTPAALLDALGFAQPSATLKLLLEVAEWALAERHDEVARGALAAAAGALDFRRGQFHIWRDRVDRAAVAEALMYRLLYLSPPLVAWALDQLPRWQVADLATVAAFVEDCALERPELAPLLRDAGLARPRAAQTFAEYSAHLDLVDALRLTTGPARAAVLRGRTFDPEGFDPAEDTAPVAAVLARLFAWLSDADLARDATFELARVIAAVQHRDLPAIHAFVARHWAALPEHPRAVYTLVAADRGLVCVPDVAALLALPLRAEAPAGAFAADVARHRSPLARDYEATRIEDELSAAERACQRALEAAREGGGYAPSDTVRYTHECALQSTWLEYRALRDPRFKDVLARHELAVCALAAPRR
ncbi:MAG: hypothetical protein R3F49_09475 [Planctomycetota bacterium]